MIEKQSGLCGPGLVECLRDAVLAAAEAEDVDVVTDAIARYEALRAEHIKATRRRTLILVDGGK
jgi:hypothetical protein